MPRSFLPGQSAHLWVIDTQTGDRRLVCSSDSVLFEAPNWTIDGKWLIVNGDGSLFRVAADGAELDETALELIDTAPATKLNNDHVLSFDGKTVYVSSDDSNLYRVPMPGNGGGVTKVSSDRKGINHYLHGVSPDGSTLAWIGLEVRDHKVITNIFTSPTTGGPATQLTDDEFPDDGSEFSPDGQWLWFNSERESSTPGHAQLFRMRLSDRFVEQLTSDKRVNWFPHVSPDGRQVAWVSFPTGTLGHPENTPVVLRIFELDEAGKPGQFRELVEVFGGQGTMNVNSWSPDSRHLAYVEYSATS